MENENVTKGTVLFKHMGTVAQIRKFGIEEDTHGLRLGTHRFVDFQNQPGNFAAWRPLSDHRDRQSQSAHEHEQLPVRMLRRP